MNLLDSPLTLYFKVLLNNEIMTLPNIRLLAIGAVIILLLLVPLVAMQFTAEVDWKPFDFLVAGVLLTSTGLTIELVLRKVKKPIHRLILCGIVLLVVFLIWAELAVGVFGTRFAGS
jgi:Kef-type K+ transport system membrane component KefB